MRQSNVGFISHVGSFNLSKQRKGKKGFFDRGAFLLLPTRFNLHLGADMIQPPSAKQQNLQTHTPWNYLHT